VTGARPGPLGELAPKPVTLLGGLAAKLSSARDTPTEQRAKPTKTRGLKMPDLEVRFFFMRCYLFLFMRANDSLAVSLAERGSGVALGETRQTWRDPMLLQSANNSQEYYASCEDINASQTQA
jgi:hypothetical protein